MGAESEATELQGGELLERHAFALEERGEKRERERERERERVERERESLLVDVSSFADLKYLTG